MKYARRIADSDTGGAAVLFAAAVAALVWANSPLKEAYVDLWTTTLSLGSGPLSVSLDLQYWVNDLLMAVFFFVIALEIRQEFVTGALRERRTAILPAIGAVGGVILPAIIFLVIVTRAGSGEGADGWAVPTATDIAFSLGVLALFGTRLPGSTRAFLLALAVIDDVIAIAIIATFYSESLSFAWLGAGLIGLLGVALLVRLGQVRIWPYVLLAGIVWFCVFESGVHATIAGVALGLLVPVGELKGKDLQAQLNRSLMPFSTLVVLPLFALANAGIFLGDSALGSALTGSLAWAVIIGLTLGKLAGVFGAVTLARKLNLGDLPSEFHWQHLLGISALTGIGFTVSLFITDLAFSEDILRDQAKVGILIGSLLSGLLGAALLSVKASRRVRAEDPS